MEAVDVEPGRMIGRDISRGEAVEHEIDGLISKRHERRVIEEGERPAEEAWMESERAHNRRRREENRLAWSEYHRLQAERHRSILEALISHHERRAAELSEIGGST